MKIKTGWLYFFTFLLILVANAVMYWGFQNNFYFSDDFHWLGRAILLQESPGEIFNIEGRDFNPVFLALLGILLKIFGLSPLMLRVASLLTFSAAIWMFFFILYRYFKIDIIIALSAALLSGFSVFVSEVVLNLAALVYSLSFLLFLVALKFYFQQKRWLYLLFILLAFFTKETIILTVVPLFFYENKKNNRLFIVFSTGGIILFRMLLQITAITTSYTSFISFENIFYKLYFIILRTMNLSPYSIPIFVGIIVIIMFFLVVVYFIKKGGKEFLFFLILMIIFTLFFSLLPKLSSRYFFYPGFGFWGIAALLTQYFKKEKKFLRFALIPLVLVSILFNFALIKGEIGDYKILGDFSKQFIHQEAVFIKNQSRSIPGSSRIILYKRNNRQLLAVYRIISKRNNLPKLLPPTRPQSTIAGVMEPQHLIPIIFYPEKIVRWQLIKETSDYFIGELINN
jgi:hypothetical protein